MYYTEARKQVLRASSAEFRAHIAIMQGRVIWGADPNAISTRHPRIS